MKNFITLFIVSFIFISCEEDEEIYVEINDVALDARLQLAIGEASNGVGPSFLRYLKVGITTQSLKIL